MADQNAIATDASEPSLLIDQMGNPVQVASTDVPNALSQGYGHASPEQIQYHQNAIKYGTTSQQLKTFGEGAVKGIPFIGGPILKGLSAIGLEDSPEDIQARENTNPGVSTLGQIGSTIAGLALAPEGTLGLADFANPVGAIAKIGKATEGILASRLASQGAQSVAAKVLSKVATAGAAGALEGAAFGAGNVVNEAVLGDLHTVGQHAMSEIGLSAILGGTFGATLGGLGKSGELLKEKFFPGAADLEHGAISDTIKQNASEGRATPRSSQDLAQMVNGPMGPDQLAIEGLPQKAELTAAEQMIPDSKFPVHGVQYESLNGPMERRDYKIFLEDSKDPDSANFRNYEAHQKLESRRLLNETIEKVAPGAQVTNDVVKGGQNLVDSFNEHYQAEKKELAPMFKKFDKAAINPVTYPGELVGKIEEAIPGMSNHVSYDGANGSVSISKYKPTMGISKEAYDAVKDLIGAVNEERLTLNDVRNLRESMRDRLNLLSSPRDQMQIGGLRKSLMDFMEGEVAKSEPDLAVRETFKKYAINEQNRETIEKILGGKIGDRSSFAKNIKMEDVLDRVFSNTETVKAAKSILGGNFNEAMGNYLSKQVAAVTDNTKNGFSSNRFGTFLRGKNPELSQAFTESPETLARIQALTKKMQILPDAPPVNPSQTATTIMQVLGGVNKFKALFNWKGELANTAMKLFEDAGSNSRNKVIRDLIMSGKSGTEAVAEAGKKFTAYNVLHNIGEYADNAQKKILSGAGSVFKGNEAEISSVAGSQIAKARTREEVREDREKSLKDFEKKTNKINSMVQNPEVMMNHLNDATEHIQGHAPILSAEMQKTASAAMSFLAAKAPKPIDRKPLSAPWKPTPTEIAAFNHQYDVVSKPSLVFGMIKSGRLTPLAVQAVATVYPEYYNAAKQALLEKMSEQNGRIPYQTRAMLSLFSGQDLDESTTPRSIAMNQMVHQSPSQQSGNQQPPGMAKPSQKGLSGISNIGKDAMSPQKALISRK